MSELWWALEHVCQLLIYLRFKSYGYLFRTCLHAALKPREVDTLLWERVGKHACLLAAWDTLWARHGADKQMHSAGYLSLDQSQHWLGCLKSQSLWPTVGLFDIRVHVSLPNQCLFVWPWVTKFTIVSFRFFTTRRTVLDFEKEKEKHGLTVLPNANLLWLSLKSLMNTRALGGPTLGIETSFRSHFPTSVGKLSYDRLLLKIPSEAQSFLAHQPPSYSGNECPFKPRSEPTKARAVCSTTLWPWGNSALPSECWAPWAKTRTLRSQHLSETQPSPRAYQGFEYFFWRIPAVLRLTIHMSFPTELKSMEFWNQTNKRFQT